MPNAKSVKNEIAGKAKRLVGEVLGDQEFHDEGCAGASGSRRAERAGRHQAFW
jgi:uncharacterized protein YjbJ (UPF0337 family)